MNRLQALRRVLFLKNAPAAAVEQLAREGRERRLDRGETLFGENERCLGLIVVLCGTVTLFKTDPRGRELTLGRDGPGASVGELALFDGGNYPFAAAAAEDATIVLVVPRERFAAVLAEHPVIAGEALRALAVYSRKLIEMLKAQTLHSVRARLAAYLLHAAANEHAFLLRETNETIGGHVGTVREVVSRTLHALVDAGAITLDGRRVSVRDHALLARLAQADASD